jgi:hypothetical protein
MNDAHDPALRALLLHRLEATAAAALEDRIVLDDDFAERLELERIDLLDDYAADRLDAIDREAVERHLLVTPADRHRVALARMLINRAQPRRSRRWLLPAGAALAACLALVVVLPQLRSPAPLHLPDTTVAPESSEPRAAAPAASSAGPVYTVTLLAEAERGAASQRIDIPAGTGVLHLQLEVPQPIEAALEGAVFQVLIRDDTGERFVKAGLPARDSGPYRIVEVDVPRAAAGEGNRQVILSQGAPATAARELFTWQVQLAPAP